MMGPLHPTLREGAPTPSDANAAPSAPLRVLDLFSGIGGFSLGLERAGMKTVAFCEISAKCRHLLKHHWPEVPAYDDICTLTAERLAADGIAVDAICGGFPCQDISLAGKGAGLAGERSGLWREYCRLIRELRPKVVIVENVSALLGRGLGDVLGDLAALGYDAWWDCIPARAVGAPHIRDRLWIIAYARSEQHEGFGDAIRREVASELLEAALAYANSGRSDEPVDEIRAGWDESGPVREAVADADSHDQHRRRSDVQVGWGGCSGEVENYRLFGGNEWSSEPDVGRVAHGVPARVDRLHGLGNAVVPEIPYRLGRAIQAARLAA